MKALSLFIVSSYFAVSSFAQAGQTVTLVFVTAASETFKNYEAVIDDVSYYSENTPGNNNRTSNNRNTIWLNNFQHGQHSIQVYNLKNGNNEERAGTTPVYISTFTVRQGFDTKIAVRNNGQVQFSERQGADNNNSDQTTNTNNNGDYNRNTNDNNGDYNNGNNQNRRKRDRNNTTTNTGNDNGTVNNDGDSDGNYDNGANQNKGMRGNKNNSSKNGGYDNQTRDYNSKVPMNETQFNEVKETIRKQWILGSKMTALRNEFVINDHYFTTSQAKQLIEFVTDENNRLELAKASYPKITDPGNFRQLYDLFRSQSSKDEMDNFIRDYQY